MFQVLPGPLLDRHVGVRQHEAAARHQDTNGRLAFDRTCETLGLLAAIVAAALLCAGVRATS